MDNDMLDIGTKVRLKLYQAYKPYHTSSLRMDAERLSRLGQYNLSGDFSRRWTSVAACLVRNTRKH